MKVLIIEDDIGLSELITEIIKEHGFETISLYSPQEAMDWLESETPYFILLDYCLPDMSGKEFIIELLNRRKIIPPFIVATGQGDEEIAVEMMKLGATDYIIKDAFFLEKLPDVIKKASNKIENDYRNKILEDSLNISNERYNALINTSVDGFWLVDLNGNILDVNSTYCGMTGYSKQYLLTKKVHDVEYIDSESRVKRRIEIMARSGSDRFETKHKRADGSLIDLEVSITYLQNQNVFLVFMKNITERLAIEKAFLNIQKRNNFHISNSPLATIEWDSNFIVTRWSNNAEKIFGWTEKEVLGKTVIDLNFFFEEDKEHIEKVIEILLSGKTSQVISVNRNYTKERKVIYCEWYNSVLLDSNGKMDSVLSQALDITERKESEIKLHEKELLLNNLLEKLNNAQQIAKIGSWEWNLITNAVWWSEETYRIFGVSPSEYVPHFERNEKFIHPDDRLDYLSKINKALETDMEFNTDLRLITPDDELKYCNVRGKASYNSDGQPIIFSGVIIDITERKKAEEEIKRAELKYRTVADFTYDWEFWTAPNGKFLYVSPSCKRITGYDAHKFLEDTSLFDKIIHPDDLKIWQEHKHNSLSDNPVSSLVIRVIKIDGKVIYLEHQCSPINDPNGQFLGVRGSNRDVTERILFQNKLIESELKLKKAQKYGRIGSWSWDIKNNTLEWSDEMFNIFGIDKETFNGSLTEVISKAIHPDDQQKVLESNMSVINYKKPIPLEYRIFLPDQSVRVVWAEAGELQVDENGNASYLSGVVQDITERKSAEEKLSESETFRKQVFNSSRLPIIVMDSNTYKYIDCNQAAIKIYDYNSIEEVLGLTPMDVSAPIQYDGTPSSEKAIYYINKAKEEGSIVFEWQHQRPDGVFWDAEVHLLSFSASNKQLLQFSLVDITERKRAEEELINYRNHLEELVKLKTQELKAANDELFNKIEKQKEYELILHKSLEKEQELSEMKSRFISTTSHEFRTPLTAVRSSAEMIKKFGQKWNDEKKNEHLNRIITSVEYLTILLDDILILSRAESGKISFNPSKIDINSFAKECLTDVKAFFTEKHQLKYICKLKQKEFILDPKLMKFIFSNLLSNAAKYSPDGGKIELNITKEKKDLKIEVSDEGIGILKEDFNKVFDSFYRTKQGEIFAGNGLGLAIVKRAVELHNGEIKLESELGKGTKFTVQIPISAE